MYQLKGYGMMEFVVCLLIASAMTYAVFQTETMIRKISQDTKRQSRLNLTLACSLDALIKPSEHTDHFAKLSMFHVEHSHDQIEMNWSSHFYYHRCQNHEAKSCICLYNN